MIVVLCFKLGISVVTLLPFIVVSYDFFFLYSDRDHNGKIDKEDVKKIRNPAWHKEWSSFDIHEFLPINELDFQLFIQGKRS